MANIEKYAKKGGQSRDVRKEEVTEKPVTNPLKKCQKLASAAIERVFPSSDKTKADREKTGDRSKHDGCTAEKQSYSGQKQNDIKRPSATRCSDQPKQQQQDVKPVVAHDTSDTRHSSKNDHLFRAYSDEYNDTKKDDLTTFEVLPKSTGSQFQSACEKFEYFWLKEDVFSQWYPSVFYVDGKRFSFAEQYMMYQKAVLAEDVVTAKRIMAASDPRRMKQLGRNVSNLSYRMWRPNCLHVVKQGNVAKFTQNKHLKQRLFSTYPKILVEASPYDNVWGIGLSKYEPLAWNQSTWRGTNWLGFVLTEVRDELMCDDKIIDEKDKKVYIDRLLPN